VSSAAFRFEGFTLDLGRASVRRGGEELELRPKSFDVLRYLVENAGRVVSKDEIFAAVWPGISVTDDSLVQCIRDIRQALEDDAQRLIKTVPRRGYLFDALVTPVTPPDETGEPARPQDHVALPAAAARRPPSWTLVVAAAVLFVLAAAALAAWPLGYYQQAQKAIVGPPSVAVLFSATGDGDGSDRTYDYFSDGLTDDVIAALGRFSDLRLVSRASLNPYKTVAWDPQRLGRELNVRYIVDGSVRRAGERVRVSARLTDAARRVLLWSENYDEQIRDMFAVQDRLTRSIAGRLAVRISRIEQERAAAKPTTNMEAYDYVLRGRERLARITRADNLEARRLFRRAVELDPRYAAAFVGLGTTYQNDLVYGWTDGPDEALRRAYEFAHRAVVLDDNDAAGHLLLSHVYLQRREYAVARAETVRAIELNPNDPEGYAAQGIVLVWMGRSEDAIAAFEIALQFDPKLARPRALEHLGLAYFLVRRYDDALRVSELSIGRNPEFILGYVVLAAAHAELGRRPEADRAAQMVRRLNPFFTSAGFGTLLVDDAQRLRMLESLQKIGL
jgi:TolB-like protein/DNA-binding winged helix-turn-helix (wHTH) protein